MKLIQTKIPGLLVIEPAVYKDDRGFFLEVFHTEKYAAHGMIGPFVQDNHSQSVQKVLRGLHAQREYPQGKLIRVIEGEIFDVAVDMRKDSRTFGQWEGLSLSSDNFKQFYVPPGFLHGFCVLSKSAQVEYKCTDFYHPGDELTVLWNDPDIGIQWPITDPILSEKDKRGKRFSEIVDLLPTCSKDA